MKYLSLFSGIGGFELGLEYAWRSIEKQGVGQGVGIEKRRPSQRPNISSDRLDCIGYSEIDKYAIQIYEKHFKHKNYGDITTLDPKTLPDFDLVVGGFPCQAFSIAGKRRGFDDTRGTLFFDIARILKEKRPRLCLLENVKGLLSHDGGRTFKVIISTLDELGYDVQWQVLNSKNFGVPQNRERVFIVGHLRGTPRPQVFPFGQGNEKVLGEAGVKPRKQGVQVSYRVGIEKRDISGTLDTMYHKGLPAKGQPRTGVIDQLNNPTHSNDRIYGKDGISPTLNTAQGGNRQPLIPDTPRIRRLTPTECERLQGFPDGWTEGVSDTQRYKTLGNAVTVNVIQAIAEKLL